MAYLKFNKAELVNLSYSLKREIISANKTGAICNTSIVTCNTRRYHGLLSVPVDAFGGALHLLLSSLDESLVLGGKRFNLGIHCYGDIYEPRGHKYIVDFYLDPIPRIVYRVGEILLQKTILLTPDHDQVLLRYELLEAPAPVVLELKPFLAFRNLHALTQENADARTEADECDGGVSFCLYPGFPDLHLQVSDSSAAFHSSPCWYKGITYSDEYRRGFDCKEDLFVPGSFEARLKPGESLVFSASVDEMKHTQLKRRFSAYQAKMQDVESYHDQLVRWADLLIRERHGRKQITAGFSWMTTGLLRETLYTLPGLTLYARDDKASFEEILDNLIEDEQERLFRRTTQVEAPLRLADCLQQYIEFGADPRRVWKKYGATMMRVVESYGPGRRKEVALHPNGLVWAQMDHVALSWMNAYINGEPVTERAGYQVETNSFWYNSLCFSIDMENRYGPKDSEFVKRWTPVRDKARVSFMEVFWDPQQKLLADYVDDYGRHMDIRPNMLYALRMTYSPVDEELAPLILKVVDNELVTRRGIRTLSPRDVRYKGVYEGTQIERDLAYHQGCTRPSLLGVYVDVCFKVRGAAFLNKAEWLVKGFAEDLSKHGVGAFSELYDGDPPHEPHGAICSATAIAALLTVELRIKRYKEEMK